MAHDVIAVQISYDAENFWKGTVPGQDWASVLKRKTAVCEINEDYIYKRLLPRYGTKVKKLLQ